MLGFYNGYKYVEWRGPDCCEQFVDYLTNHNFKGITIYSHNGGNFDHLFLVEPMLSKKGWKLEATPIQSRMFRMDWIQVKSKKKITFLDTVCVIPMSLAEACQTFDAPLKGEIDYENEKDPEVWSRYLKRDCQSLYAVMESFQRIINNLGGQLQPTIAACAMDLFQRQFLYRPIRTNRHWPDCTDLDCKNCLGDFVRQAYYGGRVEMFIPEGESLFYYDYNSHYPACMLESMPGGGAVKLPCNSSDDIARLCRKHVGFVDASVTIPSSCAIPPLPVRRKGKLIFPTGSFRGTWEAEEILLVLECGGKINHVFDSIWFGKTSLFSGFVNKLYALKDKSLPEYSPGLAKVAKLILNSLYGKFGIHTLRQRFVFNPNTYYGLKPYAADQDIWIEDIEIDPKYLMPQIAARVTAIARRRLWLEIRRIQKKGGKIYYCDTDSVVTDIKLKSSQKLGELKLEDFNKLKSIDHNKPNIKYARFVLPKLYYLQLIDDSEEIKSKGFSKGIDGEGITLSDFSRVLLGAKITRRRIMKIREAIRKRVKSFAMKGTMKKGIKTTYDKRVVRGVETFPIELDERLN